MATLRRRGIFGVLAAEAAGFTGARLLTIALPWFVLTSTGSTTQTGLVAFAQMGPYVVCQLLGGPIIDRIGPRRVSIIGDAVAALGLTAIPLLHLMDVLSIPLLMLMIAVVGGSDGPANVAKSVFVPSAARAAGWRLERATGIAGAIERTATTIGPAIAGVVVGAVGGVYAMWVTAAFTALAGMIVALAVPDPPTEPNPEEGYFSSLRKGAGFLRREKLLRSITGMVFVTNLLDQAWVVVLLPLWAKNSDRGPEVVGMLLSVSGLAAVAASLTAATWGHRLPRRMVYLTGFLIAGLPRFLIMMLDVPLWSVVAVFFVSGLGAGFINPIIGAVQYERVPQEKLGRVSTMTRAVAWSGIPFGGLVGSAAVAAMTLSGTLLVLGTVYLLATLLPGLRPEWAAMDRATTQPRETAEPVP